ncbi:hypothetical protein CLOP_g16921, partial [Closterium sp. NIES-67]
SENQS